MKPLEFLKQAELYAMDHGDEMFFRHWYTRYREWNNIEDSTWYALAWLYNDCIANTIRGEDMTQMQLETEQQLHEVRMLKKKNAELMAKIKQQEFFDDASCDKAIAEHAAEVQKAVETQLPVRSRYLN